ncbi:MAG: SBBP repeat-containing protein [Candidatus Zixiibacteriota bacterium]
MVYDASGNEQWARRYGTQDELDIALALAIDESRNVYVTGRSQEPGQYCDFATIMYDSLGSEVWVKRYDGPDSGYDEATDLALDASGNIYVTGSSEGGSIGYDFATIKYAEFLCGDANADQTVDIGDVVYLIGYLYKNGPAPNPPVAGDVNGDGIVNLGDVVYLVTYLYKSGLPPCWD